MESTGKTIAKNTVFLYVRMLVVMAVTFFTARVILKSLGATDYGIYNVVGGVVTMLGFLNSALSASTSRFLTYELGVGDREKLKITFSASLNLHIIIALLVLILGETIGLWFFSNKLVIPEERMTAAFWVYQFSIFTTMVNFTQVPYSASLISHENMSVYAYVGLYEALMKLAIAFIIMYSPIDRLIFYGFLLMANTLTIQLFYRFYTKRRYEECRFRIVKDKTLYKTLVGYSGWDLFGNLASVCQNQGVSIVLNLFFGPLVNAARAIAVQIQNAVKMFTKNFMVAVRPRVVKNYAENKFSEMYSLTFTAIRLSLVLMMALVLPLLFETEFVLKVWLDDGYPPETALFARIILISAFFDTIENGQNMSFHAIGRIKKGNLICGTIMILSLPLGYLLLKLGLPAESVFYAVILTNVLNLVITLFIMKGYVNFSIRKMIKETYIPVLVVAAITLIFPFAICKYYEISVARFFINCFSIEIVLLITSWLIVLKKHERKQLVSVIKNKFYKK